MWKKTLALAVELPFEATEEEIWSKLVERHPKYTEFFITATTTLDILKLPYIAYSFVKWIANSFVGFDDNQIKKFVSIQTEFLKEFRRRMITEHSSFSQAEKDEFETKYKKFKTKLDKSSNLNNIFIKSLEFLKSVEQELIKTKENENKIKEEDNFV